MKNRQTLKFSVKGSPISFAEGQGMTVFYKKFRSENRAETKKDAEDKTGNEIFCEGHKLAQELHCIYTNKNQM